MKYGCTDRRFVESTLRFPSPLTSPPSSSFSRARERAERNPLACKNSTKTIAIIVRYDIDPISRGTRTEREREFCSRIFGSISFFVAKGSSEADSNRFPSFGRCSFSRDGCASLRLGREREREMVATLGFLETSSSRHREEEGWRGRRVSFFGGKTRFGSTGCCSLGSTWQMGGEDSCRGWRGEKGKGASWGREEGKARERLSRRFVATCPLPSAGTRVCTHDTVKLPRQKQLPYRPTVRAANPGQ